MFLAAECSPCPRAPAVVKCCLDASCGPRCTIPSHCLSRPSECSSGFLRAGELDLFMQIHKKDKTCANIERQTSSTFTQSV